MLVFHESVCGVVQVAILAKLRIVQRDVVCRTFHTRKDVLEVVQRIVDQETYVGKRGVGGGCWVNWRVCVAALVVAWEWGAPLACGVL
jgi:hypothetical protein